MSEIFISHIHEEKEIALAVKSLITHELPKIPKPFLSSDSWQTIAGEKWLDRIHRELKDAKILILILSRISVSRPWVNFEAGAAWIKEIPLIPACFGGQEKGKLPRPYADFTALDLHTDAYDLIKDICQYHNNSSNPQILIPPPKGRPPSEKAYQRLYGALDSYTPSKA
jgi:hypothetical protein